jgi:hypothetical protein
MHYSDYSVIVSRTWSLYLQTCFLKFLLWLILLHGLLDASPLCLRCLRLLVLVVLTQCSCVVGMLWWGELREERPLWESLRSSMWSSPLQFSFRMAESSIWRWIRFLSYYGAIAETRLRMYIRLLGAFPMQVATTVVQTSRNYLQLAQTWPKFWQLSHCVRLVWTLYHSFLIIIGSRLFSLNISWYFYFLIKVTRKRGSVSTWVVHLVLFGSGRVFSASLVSVTMSLVLRGAKNLRAATAFEVFLTAVDIGTDLV